MHILCRNKRVALSYIKPQLTPIASGLEKTRKSVQASMGLSMPVSKAVFCFGRHSSAVLIRLSPQETKCPQCSAFPAHTMPHLKSERNSVNCRLIKILDLHLMGIIHIWEIHRTFYLFLFKEISSPY